MSALANNLTQSPFVCPAALVSGTKIGISTPCGINYSYHCVTLVWGPIWNTYLPRVQHLLTSYSNAFASFSLHLELTIELPRKARARRRAAMIASEILRKRSAHGACFTSTSVLYHLWLNQPSLHTFETSKIMEILQLLFLLICSLKLVCSSQDLSSYPFKATLNTEAEGGLYELYWNFDNDAETISFAVRVQTSGWVGFGLSPNGQMPDSDVVIGWVTADGETMFHVSV